MTMATFVEWVMTTAAVLFGLLVIAVVLNAIGWCFGYGFWQAKLDVESSEDDDEEEEEDAQS